MTDPKDKPVFWGMIGIAIFLVICLTTGVIPL